MLPVCRRKVPSRARGIRSVIICFVEGKNCDWFFTRRRLLAWAFVRKVGAPGGGMTSVALSHPLGIVGGVVK
jgi:hypothetical protein